MSSNGPQITDEMIDAEIARRRNRRNLLFFGAGLAALVVVVVAVTLGVVALTDDDESDNVAVGTYQRESRTTAPPTKTATVDVPVAIGTSQTLSDGGNREILTYAVTGVEIDGECTDPYASTPQNGHFLVVDIEVETTANYTTDYDSLLSPYQGDWSIVGPDGITETGLATGPSYGCTNSQVPDGFAPNSKYAYKVSFDTRNTTGTLRYIVGKSTTSWKY